jgi:UDP-glucuronate decarboxylase
VLELTGSRSELVFKALPADDPRQRKPDISAAKKEFGWEPTTCLKAGLLKTVEYFDKYLRKSL